MDKIYEESRFTCIEQVKVALKELWKVDLSVYEAFITSNEIHPSEFHKYIKTDINTEYTEYLSLIK